MCRVIVLLLLDMLVSIIRCMVLGLVWVIIVVLLGFIYYYGGRWCIWCVC